VVNCRDQDGNPMIERMTRRTRWSRVWLTWPVVVCVLTAAGCAPRAVRITHEDLGALTSAATVSVGRQPAPAFVVATPGNTVVGSVSGVSAGGLTFPGQRAANQPIEAEYGLDDPAIRVRGKVLDALAFEAGIHAQPSDVPVPEDERVEAVQAAVGREGWVLDVKTLHWGVAPDPNLWTRYRVSLAVRGRLIDLARGRIVWLATCDATEPEAPSASTLSELVANDAESLKTRLAEAADRCGQALVDQLFAGVK
jgi:hypothetical protein